jgi:hypothetical protein
MLRLPLEARSCCVRRDACYPYSRMGGAVDASGKPALAAHIGPMTFEVRTAWYRPITKGVGIC